MACRRSPAKPRSAGDRLDGFIVESTQPWGALSFGDFSLRIQRKVTRATARNRSVKSVTGAAGRELPSPLSLAGRSALFRPLGRVTFFACAKKVTKETHPPRPHSLREFPALLGFAGLCRQVIHDLTATASASLPRPAAPARSAKPAVLGAAEEEGRPTARAARAKKWTSLTLTTPPPADSAPRSSSLPHRRSRPARGRRRRRSARRRSTLRHEVPA